MKTRLTPYYINLVYDACLKSFWRKKALSKFLRQCGVADAFINNWGPDESKREFLDRLFVELPKTDRSRSELLHIASFLMEQKPFPISRIGRIQRKRSRPRMTQFLDSAYITQSSRTSSSLKKTRRKRSKNLRSVS